MYANVLLFLSFFHFYFFFNFIISCSIRLSDLTRGLLDCSTLSTPGLRVSYWRWIALSQLLFSFNFNFLVVDAFNFFHIISYILKYDFSFYVFFFFWCSTPIIHDNFRMNKVTKT